MNNPIARLRHHGQHSERQKAAAAVQAPPRPAPAVASSRIPAGPVGVLAVQAPPMQAEAPLAPLPEDTQAVPELPAEPGTYRDGPQILDDHAEWRYLYDGGPVRPPTEDELATYAARASDPAWASIYRPAPEPLPERVPAAGPVPEPPVAESLPEPAPALPPLPEAQEEAMGRFLAAQAEERARVAIPEPDEHDISDEEFEAAKADVIARFGAIPPSLQRVIDQGGRFGRADVPAEPEAEPGTEEEEPEPAAAEVPAPVAEDVPEVVAETQEDDEGGTQDEHSN